MRWTDGGASAVASASVMTISRLSRVVAKKTAIERTNEQHSPLQPEKHPLRAATLCVSLDPEISKDHCNLHDSFAHIQKLSAFHDTSKNRTSRVRYSMLAVAPSQVPLPALLLGPRKHT